MLENLKKTLKKAIYFLNGMGTFKRLSIPNGEVFFSCGGIGDSLYVALFVDAYFEKEHMNHLTLFIQENHKDIIELCNIKKVKVVYYKKEDSKALYYYLLVLNKVKPSYRYKLLQPNALNIKYEKLSQSNTLEEVYKKYIFSLDSTFRSPPQLRLKSELKNRIKVKENAVLLMPDCHSISSLSSEFWMTLIASLTQRYCVYINGVNVLRKMGKKLQINNLSSFSIVELFDAAPLFEHIISVRSGMCDLFAKQVCNLIVLYPYCKKKNYFQMFAMDKIPHVANLTELQDTKANDNYLLEEILKIV